MTAEATREKIIEAATDEFADVGYEKATVRNISCRADVNLSAINYHFSSKSELYRHVFDRLCNDDFDMNISLPIDEITSQKKLEELLLAWIEEFMTRVFEKELDEDHRKYRIISHEILNPSEIYSELLNKYLRRDIEPLIKIFSLGMPSEADHSDVMIKVFAMMGKCFFYAFHRKIVVHFSGIEDFGRKHFNKIIREIFNESVVGLQYS